MALLRSMATVGSYTLLSRVLGFARDMLIAAYLGAGPVSDAFFVAFKIPNFMRRMFAEGAFSAGFVPLFAGLLAHDGREAARRFAEQALAVLLPTLLVLVLAAEVAMPWLVYVFAPGFADDPERYRLTVEFTRLTFPYILFISLASLYGGILNSLDRFAAFAAAPILLNLCLIGSLLALSPVMPTGGHALAHGVAVAGAVQFLWLVAAAARAGMSLRLPRPRLSPQVKKLFALIMPVAVGAGVAQINLMVDTWIASFLPSGAVSYLYYADRVNQLPLGVIGVAVGTALLPLLSRQLRIGQTQAALASQNRAIEAALLLTLPAAAALIVLAGPIVGVLFERGAFGAADARATAAVLAVFATGLPAFVMVKVLTPGYFARQDTKTPVKIAVACLIANVAFNLALIRPLGYLGIALATVLSSWLNVALLARGLRRDGILAPDARLKRRAPRMVAASAAMAAALWMGMLALAPLLDAGAAEKAGALAALVALGGLVFGAAAQVTGATDLGDLREVLRPRARAADRSVSPGAP